MGRTKQESTTVTFDPRRSGGPKAPDLAQDPAGGAGRPPARLAETERALSEARRQLVSLERERDALRVELENWRWDATMARRELFRLQTSRLWRLAHLYWRFRRGVGDLFGKAKAITPPPGDVAPSPVEAGGEGASRSEEPCALLPIGIPAVPKGRYDVLFFSVIDWDFRFQRPQQLATQFGHHGHRVFYLSTSQFLAAGDAAWAISWKAENVAELRLRSRRALDIYAGRLEPKDLDALEESISTLLEDLACGDVVCLVQIPFWAPLAERLRHRFGWRVVYDCMDEWTNFPGIGEKVLELEKALVEESDLTVVTAARLEEKFAGRCTRLLRARNGMDPEHYLEHYGEHELLGDVGHPIIGYFGALASWVDVELLEKISRRFPEATLVLAGGVFDVDLSGLENLPNVRLLGQRPYEEMPKLLFHFDVCLIPFLVNPITKATNPVKFYEYLWSGKPVVAPRLNELVPHAELCLLAGDHEEFLDAIRRALEEPADSPLRERRHRLAEENSWGARYHAIHDEIVATFPLVSVIVVTYGSLPLTRRCLESLLEAESWPRLEVLVVDNASPDGTVDYLRRLAECDRRVHCLFQERNLGFPAANNVGIAAARGEVILLLNNDTIVPPGLVGRLCRHLREHPEVGVLCATTNFCGNEAKIEPGYDGISDMPRFAAGRARHHAGRLLDLPVAAMYCVAARRRVIDEVGALDEAFGVGMFEDDDYSMRVRAAGYRVACAEDAYLHHVGQGSFQSLTAEEYRLLWERNQQHYETKWGRKWEPHTLRSGASPVSSKVGLS